MKRVLSRIRDFIRWCFAWLIGHLFYKGKYLHGKYFKRFGISQGWRWMYADFFMQKIVGVNRHIPFPVNFKVTVTNWRAIEFEPDSITIFQKPGNYYQASGGAKIKIGHGVFIACNVGIITANHDPSDLTRHLPAKDVVIGAHSWIGLNSVILPGVILGEHTVVGAGSVVTKSFPQGHCVIAGNPARVIKELDGVRMTVDSKNCTGCMLCAAKCPTGAISFEYKNGFKQPVINNDKCVDCGLCARICPVKQPLEAHEPTTVYAMRDADPQALAGASSGGAFGLLGREILSRGGVVSGVRYDTAMKAVHALARTEGELEAFRGSKYLQSETGEIFAQLKKELDTGAPVLASGTPCQIAAVKEFFGDKYDNLYLVDLICHGVQSPQVFENYIAGIEEASGKKVVDFRFRDKTHGWKKSNVKIIYDDHSEQIMTRAQCEYFKYFNYLRSSCYSCRYRGFRGSADITIGDYWGVETLPGAPGDDLGMSIVLVNTPRGAELLNSLGDRAVKIDSDLEHALATHKKLKSSIPVPPPRNRFFTVLHEDGWRAARKFYRKKTRMFELKQKIKHIFRSK